MKGEIIVDRTTSWFERIINNPRLERAQVYYLYVILGFFLGYFYFRFQIAG